MKILVLNSGSRTVKSCLYELNAPLPENPPEPLWEAHWDANYGGGELKVRNSGGASFAQPVEADSQPAALTRILDTLWRGAAAVIAGPEAIDVVGHRIVYGGLQYRETTRVTPDVRKSIAELASFAPLHNRVELDGITTVEQVIGRVPQVAVFDTSFHSKLPEPAVVYPGPYEWFEKGIRRFGFHGINHQYCAQRAAQILHRDLDSLRLITCHLGGGCSLAAIRRGASVDTTMGFTPLEGLMMSTRSGSVDPGILIYLLEKEVDSLTKLSEILYQKSGLLGISGVSGDMREVLAATKKSNPRAKLAFDIYVHRLRGHIGAMLAVLGGLDAIIFTGGVGEHSPEVRAAACETFRFLGLELDTGKNAASPVDQDIAAGRSAVRVLLVRAGEEWAIARECWALFQPAVQARL